MKKEIIGHSFQVDLLQKALKEEKDFLPFLFSGPDKLGKKTIALYLSSIYLNSENLNSHPDFIFLEPKTKSPFSRYIAIDQIRYLSFRLSLKPILAKKIVVVIDEAHKMTQEAQNSFLKTLEEPKVDTLIFLISPDCRLLLPTITSRCQEIKFYPVCSSILFKFLQERKIPKEEIEKLIEISQGRPGRLIDYLEGKDRKREYYISLLKKIHLISYKEKFEIVEKIVNEGELEEVLIFWLEYGREILRKRIKELKSIQKVKKFLENLEDLFFSLSYYSVNHQLALENFILKI